MSRRKLRIFGTVRGTLEFAVRDQEEAELVAAVVRELSPKERVPITFELVSEWSIGPEVSPIRERAGTKIDGISPSGTPG